MIWQNPVRTISDEAEHVTKFVHTGDDAVAETVLYRYPDYATRTVICCSTMSGCPVGCRFCGAGDSFVRVLTDVEIFYQVASALQYTGVDVMSIKRLQVMFMAMGEPMLNMRHLISAIRHLHEEYPHAELLVSTTGPIVDYDPFIKVAEEIPTVGLQLSVHESLNAIRDVLIPFKHKLSLFQLGDLGKRFRYATHRPPFINYCAHEGNTSDADAKRLALVFPPDVFNATVSVVCERNEGMPATNARQKALATAFAAKLLDRGYNVRVFDPAGQDTIGGGCGQLWFVQEWMRQHPEKARPSIGRSLPVVHAPK